MHVARVGSRPDARRRWKALAALAALAVLVHAGALSGLDWVWPQRDAPPLPANPMQVRAVIETAPVVVADLVVAAPMPARAVPAPLKAPTSVKPPAAPARSAAPIAPAALVSSQAAPPQPPAESPAPAAPTLVPIEAAAAPAEETIPHYRTQTPPAVTLRYELQRGALRGTGEIGWRPSAEGYELKLEGRVAGLTLLAQVSQGGFDGAGIAPLRFTDRRIRRPLTAANFQREAGKITFSGPQTEYPLHAGAQDRLSWMIQLGAIVAAEPALEMAGAKVVMFVVGSHGDAGVWAFRSVGPEAVETRSGSVAAIKFVREPRGPYDTTVEVWLDPRRHHLPVRASLRAGPNDDGLDLRLQDMDVAP
jgi:hypothetical protein